MAARLLTNPIGLSVVAHAAVFGALVVWGDGATTPARSGAGPDLTLITVEVTEPPRPARPAPPRVAAAEPAVPRPAATAAAHAVRPRATLPRPGAASPPRPAAMSVAQPEPPTGTDTATRPTATDAMATARAPGERDTTIVPSNDSVLHMRARTGTPSAPIAPAGGFDVRAAARRVVPAARPPVVTMLTPARPGRAESTGMRSAGGGTHEYDDLTFDARIAADGRVTIRDKPNLRARIALPGARDVGRHIAAWYRDPTGVATRDERAVKTGTVPIVGGSFDVTDWAMRAAGMDPYQRRKAQMLDRTRPARFAMSAKWRSEVLRDSVAHLPDYLDRIWGFTTWAPKKRRRILFELWDEAHERGDTQRARSGRAARATIAAFIRRRLPAGSAEAYPAREIKILNARRRSHAAFAPYATPPQQ